MKMPHSLIEDWTPDEVAECINFADNKHKLYIKLWSFVDGTCTTMTDIWGFFTEAEQDALNAGAAAEWAKWKS